MLLHALLIAMAIGVLYPIAFSVNAAFKSPEGFAIDRFALAWPPSLDSLGRVWSEANVARSLRNSVIVAMLGVVGLWAVAMPAGFAYAKLRFRGRNVLFLLLLATFFVPIQTILVPFFLMMKDLGLLNSLPGLALAFVAFGVPLTTFMFAAYFRGIPTELIEAASIDGASLLRTFVSVVIPLSVPALITTGILNLVWMMNDLLLPILVIQQSDHQLLAVATALTRGQWAAEPTLNSAGILFGILPMLLIFLVAQRHLVRGLTSGATR